jgi:hypothetical protein
MLLEINEPQIMSQLETMTTCIWVAFINSLVKIQPII